MIRQLPAIIVVFPLVCAFLIFIAGWMNRRLCFPLAVSALAGCAISSVGIFLKLVLREKSIHYWLGGWAPPWGIEYRVDHLSALMLMIVSCLSLLIGIHSKRSVEKELPEKIPQFWSLFILLVTGLLGITITGDIFNLFVLLEVASLTTYALIALGEKDALFASFRYLIIGTIGASWFLLGVGYLYIATGSLNMAELSELLPGLYRSKAVLAGFAFILVGIGIKAAIFPLHVWLPNAYTSAPSAVSSIAAPLMTKVMAYVMFRILFTVFKPYFSIDMFPVTVILRWLAAAAMLAGSIMALAQKDLKRMLCYIIVAEVGYIFMGIAVANRTAMTGAVLHILNDALMMACLFMIVAEIMYTTGIRDIYSLGNLNRKLPLTMAAFVVAALSMAGIPPMCGFFSKWYLLLGAIGARKWMLAVILLISGLLNAILFFRVIENSYFQVRESAGGSDGEDPEIPERLEIPFSMGIPLLIVSGGIVLLGIFSGSIIARAIQFAVPAGL